MTEAKKARGSSASDDRIRPSEAEIVQLLQDSVQQYEECMLLADSSDILEDTELIPARYAWDNPIGLVVTSSSRAELV